MRRRASGILLHLTSLPSRFGIGDLGPGARWFADLLAETKQSVWQILPIGPTSPAIGSSPYSSPSAFAANPLLISLTDLVRDGFLYESDVAHHMTFSPKNVDYGAVEAFKKRLLRTAFEHRRDRLSDDPGFQKFCAKNSQWLHDYALFMAIKGSFGGSVWNTWPQELRDRNSEALARVERELFPEIRFIKFKQYLFFRQWKEFRKYCARKQVHIIGDAPIYVTFDSADVWANPQYFKLDEEKSPIFVAGVPPDYFSRTGQLWGNPVFNWDRLREDGFSWWIERVKHNVALYDMVRIDHFRGFAGYWEVPAGEETAVNGEWVDAPGMEFFDALCAHLPHLPIIAEDLGVITPDVRELRDTFHLPGMKIVQFSFGPDIAQNTDALHNHVRNCIAYTGTHDNNTTRGWFLSETSHDDKHRLNSYIGHEVTEHTASWDLVRLAMSSVAKISIYPMQDLLSLDSRGRMNTPSVASGNWRWRLERECVTDDLKARLRGLTELFGRG